MNKVKILHFINHLIGGGAERQLHYLINNLDRNKFVNIICCFNPDEANYLAHDVEVKVLNKRESYLNQCRIISKLIERIKPDIIHNWLPVLLPVSLPPSFFYKQCKYITSYRSIYKVNSFIKAMQALAFLFSDCIVSNVEKNLMCFPFQQIYQVKNGHFIPNGVDISTIESTLPSSLSCFGINNITFTILYVGRLVSQKNIKSLFLALNILKNEGFQPHLLLLGKGPQEKELIDHSRSLGIDQQVTFAGFQDNVFGTMKSCQLLVLPSLQEGMPNVIFEAMAAGLPVIASDIPVHKKWIIDQQDGILFNPANPDDLAHKIRYMLLGPEDDRQKIIRNAYKLITGLSMNKMVENYTNFYLHALEN